MILSAPGNNLLTHGVGAVEFKLVELIKRLWGRRVGVTDVAGCKEEGPQHRAVGDTSVAHW